MQNVHIYMYMEEWMQSGESSADCRQQSERKVCAEQGKEKEKEGVMCVKGRELTQV